LIFRSYFLREIPFGNLSEIIPAPHLRRQSLAVFAAFSFCPQTALLLYHVSRPLSNAGVRMDVIFARFFDLMALCEGVFGYFTEL